MTEHLDPWYWTIYAKSLWRTIFNGYQYDEDTCKRIEASFETLQNTIDYYKVRAGSMLDEGMRKVFAKKADKLTSELDWYKRNYEFRKTWNGEW